jgi:phospholipid transport system substrate-binding protein
MSKRAIAISLLLFATAAGAASAQTTAPADNSARGVISALTGQVIAILRDKSLTKDARRSKVEDAAYQKMDFTTLSRLTLGPHWRELSETQRTRFVEEFKKHLTATYGHSTDEYTDEDVKVTGDRKESNGDWTVTTTIIGEKNPGGPREEIAKVDYRLRQFSDQWKIIDVTIDAVSLVANFRSQFQEIIANQGIDKLIQMLHDKNVAGAK